MIGFGFMDNQIMLLMGDQIDSHLGVVLGLSTLAAAGIGQIFSDVAGITCGGAVDAGVSKMNLSHHNLSIKQLGLRSARMASTGGGCVGVVIGCILGMSCLLWIDTTRADRLKRAEELTTIFKTVMDDTHCIIDADRSALWMLDTEKNELWSRVMKGEDESTRSTLRVASSAGIIGDVVTSKKAVNVADAYADARFNRDVDAATGYRTRTVLASPVLNSEGGVIGVVQLVNKNGGVFTVEDEKVATMVCKHIGRFVSAIEEGRD